MLFSNVEANKNDKRNEQNLSRPSSAGETRKTLLKEVPIYAGHSDTELDDSDLTLDLSSLDTERRGGIIPRNNSSGISDI